MSTAHLQGQCKLLWVDLVLSYAEVSQSCKKQQCLCSIEIEPNEAEQLGHFTRSWDYTGSPWCTQIQRQTAAFYNY